MLPVDWDDCVRWARSALPEQKSWKLDAVAGDDSFAYLPDIVGLLDVYY